MRIFRIFVFISVLLILTSCQTSETDNTNDALGKLMNMKSYVTNAEITYISDKSTVQYKGVHTAQDNGKYCIEISEPSENAGDKVLFDGKMIWHYSKTNDDKISVAIPDRPERQQIILFEFIKNMVDTNNEQTEADGECTVFSAQMPKMHKYMTTEKLWLNNKTLLPEKLIIYDDDGNERVKVEFSDFKYNAEIDENAFTVQTEEN